MKFLAALATLVALPAAFAIPAARDVATEYKVTYDVTYQNPSTYLSNVACSNGPNGLETKGYTNFSSLPNFPYIGGAFAVAGWNSPNCGSCWQLTNGETSVNILAIDTAPEGFNIALEVMNQLSPDGEGVHQGYVYVNATEVEPSVCGM
ncbi:Cerato-platanin [Wolfiporia cocos MD-104 SS10]|uniref:Cerato-platanin n=1 Tax=Wolfiporia cocos (strain MD-104) TaxID=742152 RepID=A0A2H3JK05_WOLCO|nr:Cerato-platanin [Wolfiporia cocos MD-104 SS10]